MKLLKKVYLHVIAFIILGIVYFIPLEIFWGSWGRLHILLCNIWFN